eukprot:gnl/MRDRNA2_/MRDRNA2_86721_c6_seq28.p2 gnl/MRDRNA2_/MRDRNA2_86721_c6~~gnl/MRDRNA2_/MRDRNA2_86721_c6_seq28.p2  ORF type:complete len:400 (+),score=82.02 gnl/MRDRNA2_/MRDRNA2_86721_c6_seq28:2046-3245(+)
MISCFFFCLIVSALPGTSSLRVAITPSGEEGKQPEDYWGGFKNIFTPTEESAFQKLEQARIIKSRDTNFGKIQNATQSVAFVWTMHWGTAMVRGDEASEILLRQGTNAKSMKCESFCEMAIPVDIVVHVKFECECAHKLGNLHVFDPIDNHITKDHEHMKEIMGRYYVFAGTSSMLTDFNNIKADTAMLLPHHHSNFHTRVHVEKSNAPITVGIVGDEDLTKLWTVANNKKLIEQLTTCLATKLDAKDMPFLKRMSKMQCDTDDIKGPSVRGDCFAQKLVQLDIAIVWHQAEEGWPYLAYKPPQRLVNALAVGIPAVAYKEYAGFQEVRAMAPKAVSLASTQDEVCQEITKLIQNRDMRVEGGLQALEAAAKFSPVSIGKLYLSSFAYFKEKQAQQKSS